MDDVAYLRNRPSPSYSDDGHVVECPLTRHSTGHDLCPQRRFDPIDSLIHGCPSCWREYGRDYIPNFYSRPSWEHLELPALIRQARDLETAQRILRSNLNACLRNRELRPRDMDELLYPIRNRNGDYPHGFDEPRSIRWLRRELDRAQRERMLRDYGLPYQLDELLDLTGYPRGLSYPPQVVDTLQTIALAETCGARRAREEIERDEMEPILRNLGHSNFDGIGLGGLGLRRLGEGLGLDRGLDRIYGPVLRNQGMGVDALADLALPGMIDYPGVGRLAGGGRMNPGWGYGGMGGMGMEYGGMGMGGLRGYPGMGGMGRRRGLGMGYGMGGLGMAGMGPFGYEGMSGFGYGGRELRQLR